MNWRKDNNGRIATISKDPSDTLTFSTGCPRCPSAPDGGRRRRTTVAPWHPPPSPPPPPAPPPLPQSRSTSAVRSSRAPPRWPRSSSSPPPTPPGEPVPHRPPSSLTQLLPPGSSPSTWSASTLTTRTPSPRYASLLFFLPGVRSDLNLITNGEILLRASSTHGASISSSKSTKRTPYFLNSWFLIDQCSRRYILTYYSAASCASDVGSLIRGKWHSFRVHWPLPQGNVRSYRAQPTILSSSYIYIPLNVSAFGFSTVFSPKGWSSDGKGMLPSMLSHVYHHISHACDTLYFTHSSPNYFIEFILKLDLQKPFRRFWLITKWTDKCLEKV